MSTDSKVASTINGCGEQCERCPFGASSDLVPSDSAFASGRLYENTMCNSVGVGVGSSGDPAARKSADASRASCGCYASGFPGPAHPTYANEKRATMSRIRKFGSGPCEAKCRCCDIRPRSFTISGGNASYNNPYRNVNAAISNSTSRVNDFNKMYRCGKPCSCRSTGSKSRYSRVRDSTCRKPLAVARRECRCATCKAQNSGKISDFEEPPNRKVCLDGRVGLCDCAASDGDVQKGNGQTRMSILTSRSVSGCARCESFKKNRAAADSSDGGDSTLRKAAIAENILEYEISALEYGISVMEGSADVADRGRGLYVKELKEAEPEYQNVRQYVAEKPQYANLEEITRIYGDRLGPEGQNLEDEVFYENLTSVRNSIRGIRDQNAATTRILSASANNLCFYNDVNFYSGSHSGTFPQYLQKEMRGASGVALSRSHSDKGVVYAVDERSSAVMEIAKKEMCEVKQQRLWLAQDEYKHLSSALTALATSRTSLCSSGSAGSARYDPELLRSDVALARGRVARLRRELRQVRAELTCTQQGVDTLHSVEQKISNQQGCYNITEAQAIMTELRNIQKSLTSGEKEKAELMQSLAKLKDDLTRLQLGEVSPEISTLSIPQEKLSTASQTDLCADSVPIGTRLAEMARMRLQYDESRKRIQHIQQQLADLEDKVQPGQAESDKDRLLLFQEKEQLLRELRSITPRTRSKQEMSEIQLECKRLEQDLNNALEMSNRCITDRLRLHEEKQLLLQQLRDALRSMTTLESQLKSLSASTLSVSSSSSLGSLSTTSSKGSLSSGLSFTDIYGGPQCISNPLPTDKPIDMVDLHRRVQRLLRGSSSNLVAGSGSQPSLSPRSSLSSVSPPISPPAAPPPAYDLLALRPQTLDRTHLEERLAELRAVQNCSQQDLEAANLLSSRIYMSNSESSVAGSRNDPPLSPISETPPPLTLEQEELLQSTSGALSGTPSSSGTNSRSVSAAVSDESVAGDSGVFEASSRPRDVQPSLSAELTAQVQIKLQYSQEEQTLYVGVQKVRNLQALTIKEGESVYIRAVLLPAGREAGAPLPAPLRLPLPLPSPLLRQQTLRLQTCRRQHCLGYAQVSLADFPGDTVSVRWYNILALQSEPVIAAGADIAVISHREESSDESTLIPSQTSTLTRNQGGGEGLNATAPADSPGSSEDEEDDEEAEGDEEEDALLLLGAAGQYPSNIHQIMEEEPYLEEEVEEVEVGQPRLSTEEKETNTECCIVCPDSGRRLLSADDRLAIKRSQTFSPTPQLAKNQYICRLNRSESDSSMPLYRRGAHASPSLPFDRHAAARRSLRWGRAPAGAPPVPGARGSSGRGRAPRTSLDLELDLRAQHTRLSTLQTEIQGLRDLKQRLEVAREQGDPAVAMWAAEDSALAGLCERAEAAGAAGGGERRAARAVHRACRDLYRLRRTRAPRGRPDLITFREKMVFFTHYRSSVPVLPCDEDVLSEHSSDTLKRSDMDRLAQELAQLECEVTPSTELDNSRLEGEEGDIDSFSRLQVGYQVRRSGRCKNVVEKSQMSEESFDGPPVEGCSRTETEGSIVEMRVSARASAKIEGVEISRDIKVNGEVVENGDPGGGEREELENGRFQYVVDRVLGVQV